MMMLLMLACGMVAVCHSVVPPQCPTDAELQSFRDSLDGELILPGDNNYDEAKKLKNTIYTSQFSFIVNAKSQDDVVKYIKFLRNFGLRPSLRSSGHDFIGRSAGDQTYNLNLETFKETSVNLSDVNSGTGASLTATSGCSWLDLYKIADQNNKVVVGGSAHTVALGGYFQGGGHSPMSPKLGLGVDNVISFTMVTADGDIMEINKDGYTLTVNETSEVVSDIEVFRAIMGGGGGTFGIITRFKMKLHQPPPDGFTHLYVGFALRTSIPPTSWAATVVSKYADIFLNMSENWGGYLLVRPETILPDLYTGSLSLYILHWGGYDKAENVIDELRAFHPELNPPFIVTNYATFLEYEKTVNDPVGFRTVIANRFLQDSDFQSKNQLSIAMDKILEYDIPIGCTGTLIGRTAGIANNRTSVSQDFRTGRMSVTCGTGWGKSSEDDHYYKKFDAYAEDQLYKLGKGTYLNEPARNLENWKLDFWGTMENYDRINAVKKKLDPDYVFWCSNCVGSDEDEYDTPCPSAAPSTAQLATLLFLAILCNTFLMRFCQTISFD